jgi:hypothetical protein
MTLEQIDVAGTCQCGCCGGETQEPRALADDEKDDEKSEQPDTRSAACQCGEGKAGCACSGGADCNCGQEQVA